MLPATMKLSEMKKILSEGEIRLTKSLGQNFLHDQNQLQKIVEAAGLNSSDRVLEIGPGLGPLTELLIATAGEVLAIEKDKRLVDFLEQKFSSAKNFKLLHADALEFLQERGRSRPRVESSHAKRNENILRSDTTSLERADENVGAPVDWHDWKLVSNLPYSVASPILVELAEIENPPEKIVATLQLEVAQRLVAQAGDDDYGVLSLLVQLVYEPRGLFQIPAGSFFPEPNVDSACIILQRRAIPLLSAKEAQAFKKIVKRAFSQRRKMMLKLLKQDWPKEKLESAFAELNISQQERAEQVSLEKFVELTRILTCAGM